MFPIEHNQNLIYPADFALLYDGLHDLATLAESKGVLPKDIKATWGNIWEVLRCIPGQPHYREGVCPDRQTLVTFFEALQIHAARVRGALTGG